MERKLLLYPNGNAKRNRDGHIFLYLALADTIAITKGSHVIDVILTFFVYDHIRNKYLAFQGRETKRYHVLKTEHGFDQLLPLSSFNDSRNGYLVDDCCTCGAEVYVIKNTGHVQELSLNSLRKHPLNSCFSWNIDEFSTWQDRYYYSQVFNAGGYKWRTTCHCTSSSR